MKKFNIFILVMSVVCSYLAPIQNMNYDIVNTNSVAKAMENNQYSTWEIIANSRIQYEESNNEMIAFIDLNLDELTQAYNAENEAPFLGISIESSSIVYVIGENKYATYIDFDENHGYMVVSSDFELYDFQVEGDLSYLKGCEFAFFSPSKGFKYYDSATKQLVYFEEFTNQEEIVVREEAYDGQSESGDGYIYDINAYVAERYSNYEFEKSYSIEDYEHISQLDTSIYLKPIDGGNFRSEGNCALNAAYSVLNSWRKQGLCPLLPTTTIAYNPENREPNHASIIADGWIVNHLELRSNAARRDRGELIINNIPQLYADVREVVYERGYSYDLNATNLGVFGSKMSYIMFFTSNRYSYTPEIINAGDDYATIEYYFDFNGMAQVLIVADSSSYSDHAMACLGYRKYTYTTGWWIFSTTETAYFLEVDDGHSVDYYNSGHSIWYDPNGATSSIETIYLYDHTS